MDMGFIHMGGHYKLMPPAGKLHRQFIAQAVGVLRADLPRLEGLDDTVHDNIMLWRLFAPGEREV